MKKFSLCIIAAFMLFTFIPTQSRAESEISKTTAVTTKTTEAAQGKVLIARLETIKAMDFSKMNVTEKKDLRTEVLKIQDQLMHVGGGLYISVGALIIIILILIIVF